MRLLLILQGTRDSDIPSAQSLVTLANDIDFSRQNDTVTLIWNSNLYPSIIVRNKASKEVLMIGTSNGTLSIDANILTQIPVIEVMLSNGVLSRSVLVETSQFNN